MGKIVANSVLDAALDKIATATIMTACSAQPVDRVAAITTLALAGVAMSGVDFTNADGATGRKVSIAQKTGVVIDVTGTCDHVALCDATELLYVTTATSQAFTEGNTMTFGAWDISIGDPA